MNYTNGNKIRTDPPHARTLIREEKQLKKRKGKKRNEKKGEAAERIGLNTSRIRTWLGFWSGTLQRVPILEVCEILILISYLLFLIVFIFIYFFFISILHQSIDKLLRLKGTIANSLDQPRAALFFSFVEFNSKIWKKRKYTQNKTFIHYIACFLKSHGLRCISALT